MNTLFDKIITCQFEQIAIPLFGFRNNMWVQVDQATDMPGRQLTDARRELLKTFFPVDRFDGCFKILWLKLFQ
jgi:hypothetical protein